MMVLERVKCATSASSGWFTRQEAAVYLGISERHLDRQVAAGRIQKSQPYPRAEVKISKAACDKYLKIQSN